ncbi:MAG: hypothetical protein RBR89_00795 [Candidatus Bipolaricaulis sp.]|nr:hypothetical protein [Candidatus Bipolaricaulis sp.]
MLVLACIAGFFLLSLVVQVLFNSVIVGALGLFQPLSYLQAAGLWFLIILLFGWIPLIGTWTRRMSVWRFGRVAREHLYRWLETHEQMEEKEGE